MKTISLLFSLILSASLVFLLWPKGSEPLTIAIGDSLTQQGWAEYADVDNRGVSSATVVDWLRWEGDLTDCRENKCIIMLGTNDIAYFSLEQLMEAYPKLIEATNSDDTCYVMLPHFKGDREKLNPQVDEFNEWLMDSDVKTAFSYERLTDYYYKDHTHLKEAGYKQMAQNIMEGCK